MNLSIEIREPKTEEEFEQYYLLRWRIMRQPWNMPRGSEKDDLEEESIHVAAFKLGEIIGCGRAHFTSKDQAQIRWMAVDERFQKQGIGSKLLIELEKKIFQNGAKEIILKAREKAVNLYKKQGYEIFKEGEIMFGEIKHFWMKKTKKEESEK
jgi:ribosomal protein S18 acetylase RimI-like enzyme